MKGQLFSPGECNFSDANDCLSFLFCCQWELKLKYTRHTHRQGEGEGGGGAEGEKHPQPQLQAHEHRHPHPQILDKLDNGHGMPTH